MGYIGKIPTPTALIASDITDGIIGTDKLSNDAVTEAKIPDGAIENEHLNVNSITGQTEKTSLVDADKFLISDSAASGALKFVQNSNLGGGGGFKSMQVFTSSGTYTKPSGINLIKVFVTGGGGGAYNGRGGGGAGGGTAIEVIDVSSLSSTVAVTVGTGGTAATNKGNTGGTSSFGSYCSATCGGGGVEHDTGGSFYPGNGGEGSGGDINLKGGGAETDQASRGGNSFWAGGGRGSNIDGTYHHGQPGQTGSGGGGGWSGGTGKSGGNGIVVVEEYE